MKNITIAKQLLIVLSIGVACSAHAQLLGRGGAVGGMIGGAGNFGGQLSGMGNIGGNGSLLDRSRSATSAINTDELRANRNADKANSANAQSVTPTPAASAAPAAPAAKQGGLLSGVTGSGSGNGNAQASANADSGGIGQVAGSALQGAHSTAAPVRDGAKAQADNTRGYAQSSMATASDTAKTSKQAGTSGARGTADAAAAAQPSLNASGSASGNGSANVEK